MSDFLSRLAGRALGRRSGVRPRLPSHFEPAAGLAAGVVPGHEEGPWQEQEQVTTAPGVPLAGPAAGPAATVPSPRALRNAATLRSAEATRHPSTPSSLPSSLPPSSSIPSVAPTSTTPAVQRKATPEANGLARPSLDAPPTALPSTRRTAIPNTPDAVPGKSSLTQPALPVLSALEPRLEPLTATEPPPTSPRAPEVDRPTLPAVTRAVAPPAFERPPRLAEPPLRVSEPTSPRDLRHRIAGPTTGAERAETTVNVTIGRIEVRAVPPTQAAHRPRPKAAPRMTLEDYMKRRREGRR